MPFRVVSLLSLACAFTSCERAIVEGRATNAQGEALPGVVVRIDGTDRQDLSDARGRYRLTTSRTRSRAHLQLSKSGYAPAELDIELGKRMLVAAPDATLWPLPLNPGIYAVNDHQYVATDWVVPKQYYLKDGSSAFAAELPETLRASVIADRLDIVCFRTPRYNARLSRLAPAEATVPGSDAAPQRVWVESGTIDAGLVAVDLPEGNLLRVTVDRPLEPGVYGVHWGAMEGYATIETRVYAFEIVAPPEPETPAEASEAGEEPAKAAGTAASDETSESGEDANTDESKPSPPELIEPPSEN